MKEQDIYVTPKRRLVSPSISWETSKTKVLCKK